MAKIVLDSEPGWSFNRCPFMGHYDKCKLANECSCIGGYYDSVSFDFSKCHYCTVKNGN